MNNIYNIDEVIILSKLASFIAADDLKGTEKLIIRTKKLNKIEPEKIYETILQAHLFCGFPAAIESLKIFNEHFSDYKPKISKYNTSLFSIIGIRNCKLIYNNNFKKLISNITELSPDLKEWMLTDGYGKVMGRKGLNLSEREFINVSVLCTRYYENQLHSHIKGCINLGCDPLDIKNILSELTQTAGKQNVIKALKLLKSIIKSN
ncbi:MAG TPA: carboxymuconolactone decarboxylase family protein [Ignavibacteria bacterium]|nr:carboxymuconolactone decarboxylase family protein [Ignavibacteria bacterium]